MSEPLFTDKPQADWLTNALAAAEGPPELPPVLLDRTELERSANCPLQGRLRADMPIHDDNEMSVAGTEVHRVVSIAAGFRQRQGMSPSDLRETLHEEAAKARPDVQPQVVFIVRQAAWKIVQLLCYNPDGSERHPDDLLIYDGGRDKNSGQLAADIRPATKDSGAWRVTGEMDLLLATASAAEVDLADYKSGWRPWTATAVRNSFQLGTCYPWLIFENFPDVQRIIVRVHMLADKSETSPVVFRRDDAPAMRMRIDSAASLLMQHRRTDVASVPAWPMPDKCILCPVARWCVQNASQDIDLALDPESYLQQYAKLDSRASQMKAKLSLYVRERGADLVAGGLAFGVNKPKTSRAPACDLYETVGQPVEPSPKRRKAE